MKTLIFALAACLFCNFAFVEKSFAELFQAKGNCIVAMELNDLDFNDDNRRNLKQTISDLGFKTREFFIADKENLNARSQSLSAYRLLDHGPRPGINEEAPYVGQKQISLIVPESTDATTGNPSRMTYFIQVYTVQNAAWTVTADELDNKRAKFSGEIEKVSPLIEIGQRIVSTVDKLPSSCDLFGKNKMDVIDPKICSKIQVKEPVVSQALLKKQLALYLEKACR